MNHYNSRRRILIAIVAIALLIGLAASLPACSRRRVHDAPPSYGKPYLTWQGDPSTTMTITYHSEAEPASVVAVYDTEEAPEAYRYRAVGKSWQIPGLPDGRYINSVELTGLTPGQDYYFRVGDDETFSEQYKFRSIPDGDAPIRFAIGGDTLPTRLFRDLTRETAAQDPLFLVIGGDLCYADGRFERINRWNAWFDHWHDQGVTTDGRLIPLVMAIGNHEINRREGNHEERAPFFFGFFPQGGKTYWAHQFGGNLGFIVLDTNHLVPHEEQVPFLEQTLRDYDPLPFRAAVYHVPLYPSFRSFGDEYTVAGHTHWLPLFDAYNLSVGFENHDHTFKRTIRLKNNKAHPEGTLYVGDGNAGVPPRKPKCGRWYMDKTARTPHFWIVDVSPTEMHLRALDRKGNVFDEEVLTAASTEH